MTVAFAQQTPITTAYVNIECLRAVAALAVVACHLSILGGYDATSIWARLAGFGAVGVDLFFVISGLVITSAALRLQPTAGFARTFWLRRAARLLPLYLLTSIVFLILVDASAMTSGHALFQLSTHLLMIHNWFPTTASAINPVTWTLGVEVPLGICVHICQNASSGHSCREGHPMKTPATETPSVGIREFRAALTEYIDADTPVTVTRHGQAVGLFVPLRRPSTGSLQRLRDATAKVQEVMPLSDQEIEDMVADFNALRHGHALPGTSAKAK